MRHLGRWIGVACITAVPVAAVLYLRSRPDSSSPREIEAGPAYTAPPLYAGPPQAGLFFASQRDPAKIDARGFAYLALYVPEGERAAGFLPEGPFTATWNGRLKIPTRDRYTFTFVGTGKFELVVVDRSGKVANTVVVADGSVAPASGARLRLRKGEHAFTARYTSPANGPAIVRVYWECSEFAREPIPSMALAHDASDSVAQFARLRAGRRVLAAMRCGRCHHGENSMGVAAPALVGVGGRLRKDWIAEWVANPDRRRMPRLLHGSAAPGDAADIAAFLAGDGAPVRVPPFTDAERQRGGLLFADRGCIACHTLPGHPADATVQNRISLELVAAKFFPAALVEYLQHPNRLNPAAGMPDFGFDVAAARALAAFLLSRHGSSVPAVPGGDPARGKQLIAVKGCAVCHGVAVANELKAPSRAVTAKGSIVCALAEYDMSAVAAADLREYLVRQPGDSPVAVETAEYELARSRCTNCHRWRGAEPLLLRVGGEIADLLDDDPEARVHRPPPDLTPAGSKLRTEWLVRWLKGEVTTRPRPWLLMHMPVCNVDAEVIARGLAFAEGYGVSGPVPDWRAGTALVVATMGADFQPQPASSAALIEIGGKLIRRDGGLGCIQCHGVGDRPAQEVFEAPGINLALTRYRIRKEFFHRWCRDPLRIDPTTKMTRFTDEDGRTGLTDILDGRGQAQFEAIWRYLQSLPR